MHNAQSLGASFMSFVFPSKIYGNELLLVSDYFVGNNWTPGTVKWFCQKMDHVRNQFSLFKVIVRLDGWWNCQTKNWKSMQDRNHPQYRYLRKLSIIIVKSFWHYSQKVKSLKFKVSKISTCWRAPYVSVISKIHSILVP